MNKLNKFALKYVSKYFLLYSVIIFLFLSFLFINSNIVELSHIKKKNQIFNRKLQMEQKNETLSNNEDNYTTNVDFFTQNISSNNRNEIDRNKKDSEEFNPFHYLLGYYLIFIMMSIYIIIIVNRSKINKEYEKKIKSDLLKFLYFSNNGCLIISIIFLSAVYRNSGFAPFGIGITILIIGTIYYCIKLKNNWLEIFSDNNNIEQLCKVPCTILKIVKVTFECCRCEYYDIETTTVYSDGTVEKSVCCTSICCFLWNLTCFILKIITTIIMTIAYYFFLLIFVLFWLGVRAIYFKCKENSNENKDVSVNNTSSTNSKNTKNNNIIEDINSQNNIPQTTSENSMNTNGNLENYYNPSTKGNLIKNIPAPNIVNNNEAYKAGVINEKNKIGKSYNIVVNDKVNNNINSENKTNDNENKVKSQVVNLDYNSIYRNGNKI